MLLLPFNQTKCYRSDSQPNEPICIGVFTDNGKKALSAVSTKARTEICAKLPADDFHHECTSRKIGEGEFVPEKHFYPRVVNAEVHSLIETFLSLGNDRIIGRYTNLNPQIKPEILKSILSYSPSHFQWAGTSFDDFRPN